MYIKKDDQLWTFVFHMDESNSQSGCCALIWCLLPARGRENGQGYILTQSVQSITEESAQWR